MRRGAIGSGSYSPGGSQDSEGHLSMSLILWILVLIALSGALRWFAGPLIQGRALKSLLLPGVCALGVLRLGAGLLARAPVKAVAPPWRHGELIEHGRSPFQLVGAGIISGLPFLGALVLIVWLHGALDPSFCLSSELPRLAANETALETLSRFGGEVFGCWRSLLERAERSDWRAGLFLYGALALLTFAAPTLAHLQVLLALGVLLLVPVAAIDWLGLEPGFLSRAWFIERRHLPQVEGIVCLLVGLMLLATAALGSLRVLLAFRGARGAGSQSRSQGKKSGARSRQPVAA